MQRRPGVWMVGMLAMGLVSAASVRAASDHAGGAPAVEQGQAVVFPDYADYPGIERYAPTPQSYAEARADARFVMERVAYRSGDQTVFAYLYRPAVPMPGVRLPVVVFNRGSYVREDFSPEVLMPGRRLAESGFVVIAPMLRGSGGAGGHDGFGGEDLQDLMNIVPVVRGLDYADPDRLFLYGESRGGVMTLMALRDGFPARAAAVFGTITDMAPYVAEGGPYRRIAAAVWPGFPANEAEIARTRSALRWADRIHAPLLIMHGGEDGEVDAGQALSLAQELERLGRPYEMKVFFGETHVIPGRAPERDADAVTWFRRFDTGPAAAP